MSETLTQSDRDPKTGQFLVGHSGNGGRRPGARSKLGEAFLEDLRDCWNERGASALARCAEEDPAAFCKIVASLLPKTVDINLEIDASAFAEKFRSAQAMLGNAEPPRLRRPLPGQTIEHSK